MTSQIFPTDDRFLTSVTLEEAGVFIVYTCALLSQESLWM